MSAAAERPVRLRLGTRVAVLGSLLVLAAWLAASAAWVRDRQERLAERPAERVERLARAAEAVIAGRLAAPPSAVDQAVLAARVRAEHLGELRESRRGRRVVDEPEPFALVREEVERAWLELGLLDLAWLRRGPDFEWAPRGRPRLDDGRPLDGACLVQPPGGQVRLAHCREIVLDRGDPPMLTGGARIPDLDEALPLLSETVGAEAASLAGACAVALRENPAELLAAGPGWPAGLALVAEAGAAPSGGLVLEGRAGRWRLEQRLLDAPAVLLLAVREEPRLALEGLLRGQAGASTSDWRRWLAWTGGSALVGLLFFLFLGARINGAFRPVLAAARGLGADDLEVRVPVKRSDEIGALAAVLSDLGTSLKHARRNWEREARLAAWRDVARGLAHEIKNPLTPIRGTVENLLRWRREQPERFDERVESRLGTILEEVEQLSRLATAFSDFAKLPPPQREPTDLNGLLRAAAALQLGDRAGLRCEERLDPSLPRLSLDAGQLRQVATNLTKNAREALGEGGGTVRIESGPHGGGAWFSVSDDGPGVDEASLDRLFVPGWSTRKHEGGSGLGLWLCHRIILEHGGAIEASRSELGGLRIRVTLPEG